jgi:hypothetical protein
VTSILHIVGWALFVTGWVFVFLGYLWIFAAAWQRGILWAAGVFFVPVIQFVYIGAYWKESKDGFYLELVGAALVILGLLTGIRTS